MGFASICAIRKMEEMKEGETSGVTDGKENEGGKERHTVGDGEG